MGTNWLDGIDKDNLNEEIKEQDAYEPAGGLVDPALYDVKVEEAFIDEKDSGAKFLSFKFLTADEKIIYWAGEVSLLLQSGDEKGNKKFWEKDGKKHPFTGYQNMKRICDVVGIDFSKISPEQVTIEKFGTEVKVDFFKELVGKKLKIAVQHRLNDYDNKISTKLDVIGIMDLKGIYDGEDITEKLQKRIDRTPVRPLPKNKQGGSNSTASGENKKKASDW